MNEGTIKVAAVIATALIVALALSGCAALKDACRGDELVPTHGGGYRVIPGTCPQTIR